MLEETVLYLDSSKLFFLTAMTSSELSKYLNEQPGVSFKCETTKMKLPKNIKRFLSKKPFCVMQYFMKYLRF